MPQSSRQTQLEKLVREQKQDCRSFQRPEVIIPQKNEDYDEKCSRLFRYALETLGFTYRELVALPRSDKTIKKLYDSYYGRGK